MRILYVEDNEVNRALIERVVRARKFSVVFQDEGEEALKALAEDPTIDLILLDIELAGVMSGLEVIRTLRERGDKRPVVAVTAYAMMGDRERILEAGCDQYLPKPLVIADLLNLMDHYETELAAKAAGVLVKTEPAVSPASTADAQPAAVPVAPAVPAPAVSEIPPAPTPAALPAAAAPEIPPAPAPLPAAAPEAPPTAVRAITVLPTADPPGISPGKDGTR